MTRWRIDAPCHVLGWRPPPVPVWLLQDPDPRLRTLPGRLPMVADWLEAAHQIPCHVPTDLAAQEMDLPREACPTTWRRIMDTGASEHMALSPHGMASLFVTTDDPSAWRHAMGPEATMRHASATIPLLSRRQDEALALALSLGYYDVPRRITLRALASRHGVSQGAMSELLRRGQRALVASHCDGLADPPEQRPSE